MSDFSPADLDGWQFNQRLKIAGVVVALCLGLLFLRFFWLQGIKHELYSARADENRISIAPIVPDRGLIVDRNGVVLARNYSAYTLEITPSKLDAPLEDVINRLGEIVEIQARDRRRFKKLLEESRAFESIPLRTMLSDGEVARFSAQRYRFPGVDIRARLFRQYPLGEIAAHVIGYIGRISTRDREKLENQSEKNHEDSENYDSRLNLTNYKGTPVIGKIGLEQSYETELHGFTGYEEVEVDAGGRAIRTLSTTPATPGNNLILSLDVRLQHIVESLYENQRGALVAIEPSTGDVLAFVSKPSFDPNLFVDGIDPESWRQLNESPDRPLYNRPLKGIYPPGSTYKPFMGLAGLETGKRTAHQTISDPGYFQFGSHRFRDDKEGGHGAVNLYTSIVHSCDTYYYMLARDMGVQAIHDFMKPFGFGQITGIDVEGEARGILPSPEWKRQAYRRPEQRRWYDGETISLGIGQGYNSFTILQLAHATAILANNGVVMKPHLVKAIEDSMNRKRKLTTPHESYRIPLKAEHLAEVKRAMIGVNREGTSAQAFRDAPYVAAGKTGTAQVFTVGQNQKYNASIISERMRDHALFMAFAPAEAPRIAVALIVENAGFGAQAAAPIARKVFDYMLEGKWPNSVEPLTNLPMVGQGHSPITPLPAFRVGPKPASEPVTPNVPPLRAASTPAPVSATPLAPLAASHAEERTAPASDASTSP
jgi:penicillin-binding protein 2